MHVSNFKNKHVFSERLRQATSVKQKYPDKIPIICENQNPSKQFLDFKEKYLVPKEFTVGNLIYSIRKNLVLSEEKSIFIFIDNILPRSNDRLVDLYNEYRDDEMFLYIVYCHENTFGCETPK
jgi:GABA(A) receptor-associated protein